MEATTVVRSNEFRRIKDFGFDDLIRDVVLSTTSDPSMLILLCRRANYYNTPQLLAEPLGCSFENAVLILEKLDSLNLFFHESRPARFFRTVFAVITNELPGICIPDLYERQIQNSNIDFALTRMKSILSVDEFQNIKDYYGYETNRPQYYAKRFSDDDGVSNLGNYASQSAMRKLSLDGELVLYYRRSFKKPD